MNEVQYLKLVPLVLCLIAITIFTETYIFTKKVKIFKKALFIYIFVSMLIVIVFAFIYMIVCIMDLQYFNQIYPNGLNMLINSTEEKQEILNNIFHFKGINILDYKNKFWLFFLDICYFSSTTFFTIGYGDVTVNGIVRIIPIIESVLGVSMSGIFISIILSDSFEVSKKEEILRMFILRGCDILCFKKGTPEDLKSYKKFNINKNKYSICLIDPEGRITTINNIRLDSESIEIFKSFKIDWDFNDNRNKNIQYYYKFALYLKYQIGYELSPKLRSELNEFMKPDEKFNVIEFKLFLEKLLKSLTNKYYKSDDFKNEMLDYVMKGINDIS